MAMIKDFIIAADGTATVICEVSNVEASIWCRADDAEDVLSLVRGSEFIVGEGPKYYADGAVHPLPERPSTSHTFDWSTKSWVDLRSLILAKGSSQGLVDDFAGAARLRYITSVPGQAETYAKKEEQARTWAAAAFTGDAPSFIAAEAAALNRSAQAVAEEVIVLADFWANVKGPQIEATRRKWKVAIEAATDLSAVDACVDAARTELGAL